MAKMVGVWLYVVPRKASDAVNCHGGATIIITEADKRKLGNSLMTVTVRVYDDDAFSDDLLYTNSSFQLGPALLQVGPNSFTFSAQLSHSTVANSESWFESAAELYFRVRAAGGGVSTNWANSQVESVPYE